MAIPSNVRFLVLGWLQDGSSALIRATQGGHTALVNVLLEHDARIDLQDDVRRRVDDFNFVR